MSMLIAKLRTRADQAKLCKQPVVAAEYYMAADTIEMQEGRISELMSDKLDLAKIIARLNAEIDGVVTAS